MTSLLSRFRSEKFVLFYESHFERKISVPCREVNFIVHCLACHFTVACFGRLPNLTIHLFVPRLRLHGAVHPFPHTCTHGA